MIERDAVLFKDIPPPREDGETRHLYPSPLKSARG